MIEPEYEVPTVPAGDGEDDEQTRAVIGEAGVMA
jgi:hypothetical protein